MPTAKLYTVESESGEPKLFASFTYKIDDSFADARRKLELLKYVDYEWDFLDATIGIRMMEVSERGNLIDECSSKVVIMPRLPGMCGRRTTHVADSPAGHPVVLSSGASNGISLPSTDSETIERSGGMSLNSDEWGLDDLQEGSASPTATVIASDTVGDPRVSFLATTMSPELQKAWSAAVEKLKEHMKLLKAEDQKWKVQTYDKDGQPRGKIVCEECEHTFDCASSKGIMDRISIANCFTNFKQKHLHCHKHIANLAKNRNERIDKSEVKKRVEAAGLSNRAILELHIAIVERVNTSQSLSKTTFEVVGDVTMDPVDLKIFRLYCTFCGEHLVLIPKQKNLESNLQSHCASIPHLNAVARSERPATGLPVLSGKPGRPRAGDKRDRSQKSIAGFFSHPETGRSQSGRESGASSCDKGKGTIDPKSLLCWGLWRDSVQWGQETRPIKQLLSDQLKVSGEWYSEPLVKANVWNFDTQSVCVIEGVFRHIRCSRVTEKGGGFQDLTCEHCATIKLKEDFRLRVLREERASEKRGTRDTGRGRRLGYLTVPEIQRQAQAYRGRLWREQKLNKSLQHRLCMMKLKSPRIGELCQQASNSKEILKFCQNIVLAHKRDAFGGRQALWDMLRDIASNLNRRKEGHRFRQGTKLLMQTLFLHGGRRVVDCLATNAISPSLNTLQRDRRGMAVFRAGIREDQFKFIAEVYSVLKTRAGISGPIPVYLAEDETSVKRTVRWQPKQDTLLGFCGATENHLCMSGLEITVGDDEHGFNSITSAFESYVVGHQARCVMVNPLVEGFPRLCLMATGTCNRFDAAWVRHQWDTLDSMWTTHCLEAVGPVLGHASDGDSRRRKLMLEDYTGKSSSGQKVNLGWDGWQLTHSMTKEGPIRHAFGLHDQDFIHNHKKLVNPLDSCARHLKLGAYSVTICHLALSYTLYEKADHGMNHEDVLRTDRQNWASAQRLCSRKVSRTLCMLRERKDAKRERTLGTEIYLSIVADYMDIFLNTRLTLRDRVVLCGKVGFFFRLWRLWCFHGNHSVGGNTQTINFGNSCIPMQTFLDIQMSVHMVVLLIIQFRDNFKNLPVPLHLTGSDSCEQFFSKVGGMRGHERSYDLAELVECATSLNRLVAMDLSEGIVGAGKSHKKHSNIWMKLHPGDGGGGKDADQADYTGLESNADVVSALEEGLKLAQNAATRLEMNPSTSCKNKLWWEAPWKVEAKGVREGGWCDINVDDLDPLDALDPEESPVNGQSVCADTPTPSREPSVSSLDSCDPGDDGVTDLQVAAAGARAAFSAMYADLVYGGDACEDVKPTVSFNGRKMYKSTLVAQLVENPKLSKDRLTKVKQSLYFNSLVDKRKNREGMPSMLMSIGSDIGVYFEEDAPMGKQTRGTQSIAKALKGSKRKKAVKEPVAKRRRGEPVSVEATASGDRRYNWWIGRVQCIQRKYGASVGRSREAVDLLDRPGDDAECEVRCNWFKPIGARKQKFSYDVSDPQLISVNSIISTVNITVNPEKPDVFLLHPDDVAALDTFVKNRPEPE